MREFRLAAVLVLSAIASAISLEASTKATLFYINGIWNEQNEATHTHEVLWEAYAQHVGVTGTALETMIRKEMTLYNPTEGKLEDVFENFRMVDGNVGPGNEYYQEMLLLEHPDDIASWLKSHPGSYYVKPHCRDFPDSAFARDPYWEIVRDVEQCRVPFTSEDLELLEIVEGWIARINRASAFGPVAVVAHSQGTRFAENMYLSLDPVSRQNVLFVYIGTPVEEPIPTWTEVVVHDCDIIGDPQLAIPDIETDGSWMNVSSCHGAQNYFFGSLSWQAPNKLFAALDQQFDLIAPEPKIKTVSLYLETGRIPLTFEASYKFAGQVVCDCETDEECQNTVVRPDPPVLIPALPFLESLISEDILVRPRLFAVVEGTNISEEEMALFIPTCTPCGDGESCIGSPMIRSVYGTVSSLWGQLIERESNDEPVLRASKPCRLRTFSLGEQELIVKNQRDDRILCRAILTFIQSQEEIERYIEIEF